jgi:hypothetical protein
MLNGKPLDLDGPTPSVRRVLTFLDAAPEGELFTGPQLASSLGLAPSFCKDNGGNPLFAGYSQKWGGKKLWGNKAAIAELRRRIGAQ